LTDQSDIFVGRRKRIIWSFFAGESWLKQSI
jgi:hypothetical protein